MPCATSSYKHSLEEQQESLSQVFFFHIKLPFYSFSVPSLPPLFPPNLLASYRCSSWWLSLGKLRHLGTLCIHYNMVAEEGYVHPGWFPSISTGSNTYLTFGSSSHPNKIGQGTEDQKAEGQAVMTKQDPDHCLGLLVLASISFSPLSQGHLWVE